MGAFVQRMALDAIHRLTPSRSQMLAYPIPNLRRCTTFSDILMYTRTASPSLRSTSMGISEAVRILSDGARHFSTGYVDQPFPHPVNFTIRLNGGEHVEVRIPHPEGHCCAARRRKSKGTGVIAKQIRSTNLGNGNSRLIPAMSAIPPPSPMMALPGKLNKMASTRYR